ncbi:amino acid adenylation domain-containing protein [Nocardia sp. NPDC057668]|uniref:amino acid adenylation domain-containing protein n=1 Tax=Nocardia sp. NPDC057668 TaxID=3346202 RepID=UPI00366D0681
MNQPSRIRDVLALSPLQQGLFALARVGGPDLDLYTMQFVADVDGPLDLRLLRRSAAAMLERHPNLEAAFWDENVPHPVQIIPAEAELPWYEDDCTAEQFDDMAAADRRTPFDLSRGPALRFRIVHDPRSGARRLILTAHHILMDGWSVAVFVTELLAVHAAGGRTGALPAPHPYRDYIAWLAGRDRAVATAAWADYLSLLSAPLMLAEAVPQPNSIPETTRLLLSAADTRRLRDWSREHGLTLNTAVQFAWTVLLGRLTDRRDIVYGATISGRPEHLPGVETMVGLFINTVPVAHRLDYSLSVVTQCQRLQRDCAAMRDHGYLALSDIQRAAGHGSLFDTLFVFENAPIDAAVHAVRTPDGAHFRPREMESLAHYPLTVVAHLAADDLVVLIEAVPAALPHLSAPDLGARLLGLLRQLPGIADATPDALEVLTAAEGLNGLLSAPNGTSAGPNGPVGAVSPAPAASAFAGSVWTGFEEQAARTPGAVALQTSGGVCLTYRELRAAAARLANELAGWGVGPESVVALLLPRGPEAIVALLATLAAGAAYVPVDISLPPARIESILEQSAPALLVTVAACRESVGGRKSVLLDDPSVAERLSRHPVTTPDVFRHPQHAAYLIFTSGSTGAPKGVMGTHAALLAYCADHRERVYRSARARLGRPLRIAHAWSLSFDASWQPMAGLLDGHTVHLFDAEELRDAGRLVEGIAEFGLDMIDTTPSMFAQLLAAGLADRPLPVLALGGEAIDGALWTRLRALAPAGGAPGTAVYNCYGPTETTVEAVVAPVADHETPTIGTPNTGTACYVLDSRLRPVPHGVVGELYLSGPQLARGYVGRAAATADRFVADTFRPGHRMYRTGDLVRRLAHGGLGYLGRADDQVKVRGYRIEMGEIETALRRLPGVSTAAVTVVRRAGGASLVGFLVGDPRAHGDVLDPARLRPVLAEGLPAYMIPARLLVLPNLPTTVNGKLDARELTSMAEQALSATGVRDTAATPMEKELGEILAELFEGRTPAADDDFFALGVDSIVAIALVNRARRRGLTLTPRMVLATPTIRDLAAAVDAAAAPGVPDRTPDYGEVPPLPVVAWLHEYGNYRRFTQTALLRTPPGMTRPQLEAALRILLDNHDTLRAILTDTPAGPRLRTRERGSVPVANIFVDRLDSGRDGPPTAGPPTAGLSPSGPVESGPEHSTAGGPPASAHSTPACDPPSPGAFAAALRAAARRADDGIDPRTGDMVRAAWFPHAPGGAVLLLAIHHLAVDVVSWHLILATLNDARARAGMGDAPRPLPEVTAYREFARLMGERAHDPAVSAQRDYWASQLRGPDPALGARIPDPRTDTWSTLRVATAHTPVAVTERLLSRLTRAEGVREFLLTALTITLASWRAERGQDSTGGALIALEGHGRADELLGTDTSNTVGWFTTVYPVRLGRGAQVDHARAHRDPSAARALLDSVAEHLTALPNQGSDYGVLRYLTRDPELATAPHPQLEFNYLGRVDLTAGDATAWSLYTGEHAEALPLDPEPDLPLRYALDVIAGIGATPEGPRLTTTWRWSTALFTESEAVRLTELWNLSVRALSAAL